ncbi:chitin binding-like protein [Penaeus vannamei]|uniref:Chitin binding-like protein n=1 Tax=Penaeus vannamei TaxID=6689 RepID=A0A3R7MYW4_PENVA|nr:chitin binding-like protein [Penaeus vannamei]
MVNAAFYLLVVGVASAQILVSPESRQCRDLAAMDEAIPESNLKEYTAGEVMEVKATLPQAESGVFEFYLCPETDPGDEECLVKMPLNIAGGMGKKFDLAKIPKTDDYTIPLEVPQDVTCERCTLLSLVSSTSFSGVRSRSFYSHTVILTHLFIPSYRPGTFLPLLATDSLILLLIPRSPFTTPEDYWRYPSAHLIFRALLLRPSLLVSLSSIFELILHTAFLTAYFVLASSAPLTCSFLSRRQRLVVPHRSVFGVPLPGTQSHPLLLLGLSHSLSRLWSVWLL